MSIIFVGGQRAYTSDLNNLAYSNINAVYDGCEVSANTPADMSVDVASGNILFETTRVAVSAQNVIISAADVSYDRIDLIVLGDDGTASVIEGTPALEPHTPTYDPINYVVLARILVEQAVTTITAGAITDIRTLSSFPRDIQGRGVGKYTEVFSGTSITITHSLSDLNPIVQVYDTTGNQVIPEIIDIIDNNNIELTFADLTDGTAIIQGGNPIVVNGSTAYYTQSFTAVTSVSVNHNLGQKYVTVQIYDENDVLIDADSVTLSDDNNLVVTFGVATTGKIVVTGGNYAQVNYGVNKYEGTFTNETSPVINHNLNTLAPMVVIYNDVNQQMTPTDITANDSNSLTLTFTSQTSGTVIVHGGLQGSAPGAGYGDFIPYTNNTFNIGSAAAKWKDVYIGENLYLGLISGEPSSLAKGQLWFDSDSNVMKVYDGTTTKTIAYV